MGDGRRTQDRRNLDRAVANRGDLVLPLAFGLLLAIAAAAFVAFELAEPPIEPGFRGIALSNAGNSRGARAGLALFRDHLSSLPYPASGLTLSPHRYTYGLRLAVTAIALIQAIAFLTVMRRGATTPWLWLAGPSLASVILLAYPPINTDVFSYASFGWVANQGANPYLAAPATILGDPFSAMNDWTRITTPYGPLWTDLSRIVVALGGNDPFTVAIGFKLLAAAASIGLGAAAYAGARRLTADPKRAVAAMVLVAWSPASLAESAGTAHNDAPMMFLALSGLLIATSGRPRTTRAGLLVIMAAVLIKPVAAPLFALALLIRFFRDDLPLAALKRAAGDILAALALAGIAFAPYWGGGKLPAAVGETQRKLYFEKALHVNPLWVWALPRLSARLGLAGLDTHASAMSRSLVVLLAIAAIVIGAWPLLLAGGRFMSDRKVLQTQIAAWSAVTAALGLATINAHAWYSIWAIAPVALLWTTCRNSSRGWWLAPYLAWLLLSFLVYHTWPVLGTRVS